MKCQKVGRNMGEIGIIWAVTNSIDSNIRDRLKNQTLFLPKNIKKTTRSYLHQPCLRVLETRFVMWQTPNHEKAISKVAGKFWGVLGRRAQGWSF